MKKRTIGIGKRAGAAVFAAGVCLLSAAARANDGVPGAASALSAADSGIQRAIVSKSISVGGLRSGEEMMVTGRGAERVGPATDRGAQCVESGSARGS